MVHRSKWPTGDHICEYEILGISEAFSSFDLETLSLGSGYQRSGEIFGVMFG